MTPKELAGAALAAAALVVTAVVIVGDEEPPKGGDVQVTPTRLAIQRDGGKAYVVEVRTLDGGIATRIAPAPGCVRRRAGSPGNSCQRRVPGDVTRDFGELNRFLDTEAVGGGCEPVACGVSQGEDADEAEDDVVRKAIDAGRLK